MKDDILDDALCVSEVGTSCIVEVKGNSILLHSPLQQGASRYTEQPKDNLWAGDRGVGRHEVTKNALDVSSLGGGGGGGRGG